MVRARPIGCEVSKVKVNGVLYSSLQVTAIIASPLRAICDHLQPDRGDISAILMTDTGRVKRCIIIRRPGPLATCDICF